MYAVNSNIECNGCNVTHHLEISLHFSIVIPSVQKISVFSGNQGTENEVLLSNLIAFSVYPRPK